MRTLRNTYIDLNYMGIRKRQFVLAKLGPLSRVELEKGEAGKGAKTNVKLSKNQ